MLQTRKEFGDDIILKNYKAFYDCIKIIIDSPEEVIVEVDMARG